MLMFCVQSAYILFAYLLLLRASNGFKDEQKEEVIQWKDIS
jgi:hypothetical protein